MLDLNALEKDKKSGLPPVHTWHPEFCGDMDLVVKANGDWIHDGDKIKRPKMVTLFSHILWYENGEYFLVTPVEKVRIQVEDAPFLVTKWRYIDTDKGQAIEFTTLTDDVVVLGEDCELWLAGEEHAERPYISMRYGMKAMLHRNVFYQLVEELVAVSTPQGNGVGLMSAGQAYLLIPDE
ncbi:DUF1285 domain-containing protein [Marinomonas arenicola]|uniref:DUF1285 domain-containing protein n=1 Tax=Marinomonas TaxID=28253 RepID=UPI0010547743|nr:DUF1285 domain-containing protein [Marinomonas sp. KMM3893]